MSPEKMLDTLKSKGFDVNIDEMSFVVSLTNAMMLENELNEVV